MLEHVLAPRALGAPTHTHENEDEYSWVTAGRMGALIGDDLVEAGSGELVVKPRGIPHAFWNAADEETRVLELISPGGFEQYFVEMAPLFAKQRPDLEAMGAVRARYKLSMDLDSIGELAQRFGLKA